MTDGLKPIGGGYGAAAFGTGPYADVPGAL